MYNGGRVRPAFIFNYEVKMNKTYNKHTLFKPRVSKAETKADITNKVARAIISADAERRESKIARLRQVRLEAKTC
ncbi:MAG: hypothetical protein CL557_10820 [Alphaproteobacteria bacterium]|nr:hypothetical protein [Alphaproteobacteria bacterium]|tara:strand:- start:78 stop:305 length:228 start_codon:yes stop_codon:yes gene_type:complete